MSKKLTFAKKKSATPSETSSATLDAFVGVQPPPPGEKLKRFTFDVTPGLHRRVKAGCAARGIEMADLMRSFLEKEFPE